MVTRVCQLLLLLCFILLPTGCYESGEDRPFYLQLRVVDVDGRPMRDLELSAHVPLDYPGAAKRPESSKRAATRIQMTVPVAAYGTIDLFHIDGDLMRHLHAAEFPAGQHELVFDGLDEQGTRLYGTIPFRVRAKFYESEGGPLLWEGQSLCVLYTGVDEQQRLPLGTTDGRGMILVTERRHFPFLFNLSSLRAVDLDGLDVGAIEILDEVEFTAREASSGQSVRKITSLRDGPNRVDMIWNPAPVAESSESAAHLLSPRAKDVEGGGPPVEFSVEVCRPNPFN